MTKCVPYMMTGEEVEALFHLLTYIHLGKKSTGEVITLPEFEGFVQKEHGAIIYKLYHSDGFAEMVGDED